MLKQKIAWLEATNSGLRQDLQQAREGLQFCAQRVLDALIERDGLRHKIELLRTGNSWEEVNGVDGYQTCGLNESVELLHAYTTKIHELESNIHYMENAKSENFTPFLPCPYTRHVNSHISHKQSYMELSEAQEGNPGFISGPEEDEAVAKELEHTCLQVSMDKELQELNDKLQQKEAEMTLMVKVENTELKQQFEKKLMDLEEEKRNLQMERDKLLLEIENLSCVSDEQTQKMQEAYADKLKDLESQLAELKLKQDNQTLFFKQKLHNDDAEKHLQEEIQRIKSQKVQLQHRIKQESEYFRCWKAAREKELMQLRKEGRRNEHEMLKLQALNQRQKMVLQRKTEEAALATRRLKEILEARKSSARELTGAGTNATGSFKQMSQKALQQSVDHDLEVAVHIHEVRLNYEKQAELRVSLAGELEKLQQDGNILPDFLQNDGSTTNSVSFGANPDARQVRVELLKSMLDSCSNALVSMASELSEAEERERVCSGPGRWQNLRTIRDAKALLNYVFNNAVDTRCQLWDLHHENKELQESIGKLKELLKQSEARRREVQRQQQLAEHAIAKAITTSTQIGAERSAVRGIEEMSLRFLHTRTLDSQECFHSYNQPDMLSISSGGSQYGFRKINSRGARVKHSHPQMGKLLRWKRSHERWLLQFKWKWQKPWRLSEWIRHGDESLTRARPSRMLPAAEFQQS
ncbi:hypothetical protein L7F22_051319 [Adiantum nelumboides]|nr:hypothetical protein [Adiantum nelumboides]